MTGSLRSCSDGSGPASLRDQPALGCADYPRQAARRHLIRHLLARLGHRRHGPPGRCLPANTPRESPALVNGPVAILILHRLVATRHAASRSVFDTEVCESAPVRFTDIRRQSASPSNRSGYAASHRVPSATVGHAGSPSP